MVVLHNYGARCSPRLIHWSRFEDNFFLGVTLHLRCMCRSCRPGIS